MLQDDVDGERDELEDENLPVVVEEDGEGDGWTLVLGCRRWQRGGEQQRSCSNSTEESRARIVAGVAMAVDSADSDQALRGVKDATKCV